MYICVVVAHAMSGSPQLSSPLCCDGTLDIGVHDLVADDLVADDLVAGGHDVTADVAAAGVQRVPLVCPLRPSAF